VAQKLGAKFVYISLQYASCTLYLDNLHALLVDINDAFV